jgi:two-component system, NarL family, invasion response regulator UvrY
VGAGAVSVVVVDDQLPFRLAAKTVVKSTPGFELCGEAASGEEALIVVASLRPDLVLMDINMPGISGIEATRRLIVDWPATKIILLSTYSADDLPGDARDCGAIAYINKEEFGPDVLRSTWETAAPAR